MRRDPGGPVFSSVNTRSTYVRAHMGRPSMVPMTGPVTGSCRREDTKGFTVGLHSASLTSHVGRLYVRGPVRVWATDVRHPVVPFRRPVPTRVWTSEVTTYESSRVRSRDYARWSVAPGRLVEETLYGSVTPPHSSRSSKGETFAVHVPLVFDGNVSRSVPGRLLKSV